MHAPPAHTPRPAREAPRGADAFVHCSAVQLFYFGTFLPHRAAPDGAPYADRHRARSSRASDALSLLSCFNFGGCHWVCARRACDATRCCAR
jgi:hypothetical protein